MSPEVDDAEGAATEGMVDRGVVGVAGVAGVDTCVEAGAEVPRAPLMQFNWAN